MNESRLERCQINNGKTPLLQRNFSNVKGLRNNFDDISLFPQARLPVTCILIISETN